MLKKVIEDLKRDKSFISSVSHWEVLPSKVGDYLDFPEEIDQRLLDAFSGRGITRLYSHQHETYLRARQGKNVVLVTPTASGKTLAYNLPVLQTLLEAPEARAMYLFPTKALSQDQQAGRAGRRSTLFLSILVASASPIDQYLIRHPEYFFGRSPESGWVDGDNIFILADQLKCAVFELPFSLGEEFTAGAPELLRYLEENGVLWFTHNKWFWADRSYPAEGVSLRSAAPGNIVIVDTTKGKNEVIGEMDKPSAKMLIFDEAVYLHLGNQYIVQKLDLENQRCYVEETAVNYYTDSIVKTDIKLLHEDERESRGGLDLVLGDILVRTQAAKYKKLKFHTNENVGYGDINLPSEEMHTRTAILLMAENSSAGESLDLLPEKEQVIVLQKLGTLVRNVAPVFLLCDLRDMWVAERFKDPAYGCSSIYVYDSYPGGTGLSEGLVRSIADILDGCRELVEACSCEAGCPSCIGPTEGVLHFNPK